MVLAGGWLVSRALGDDSRLTRTLRSGTPFDGGRTGSRGTDGPTVTRSITIDRPANELYETWRDPYYFSKMMGHVGEVTAPDRDRFHWTVHGPRNRNVEWETRIVEKIEGEYLRWETTEGATVPNEGWVRFRPAPGERGTAVTLTLRFDPPGGEVGNEVLKRLAVVPEALAGTALDRFKALVESGEIPTLEKNPSARGAGDRL